MLPDRFKNNQKMPEVQQHGKIWEEAILLVYGATREELKQIKYTSKMDLPREFNRLNQVDLSIKCTCHMNIVCMADALRTFDAVSSGEPLHMIVVMYVQNDDTNTKKLVRIIEVDLTNSREILFGTLTRQQVEDVDRAVKSIPQRRRPTPEEHVQMYSVRDASQSLSGAIQLNIKCNSTQSRLQCSFNQFQKFLDENPARIIAQSSNSTFRGHDVIAEISSGRRRFKKKTTEIAHNVIAPLSG